MKRIFFLFALLCMLLLGCDDFQNNYNPVNENASKEVRDLLTFLYSIQGKYTLTGQHNFLSDIDYYDDWVYKTTGKKPVVWGADFSFHVIGDSVQNYHHCGPANLSIPFDSCYENSYSIEYLRQKMIDEAVKKYHEGRIITLMWHSCFPSECDTCDGASIWRFEDRLPSDVEWNELLTDGSVLNNMWKKQVDGIAFYLKQLQEQNVPILWRPYHEMNGTWFWWCNKPGEEGYKKLWIMLYDYLTKYHKLDNLIWVWNTNAPRNKPGDSAGNYEDFFPGYEYVDVLATDVYHKDYKKSHHDDLYRLGKGKLISLGEVGHLPSIDQYESQPYWSWFMVWGYFIYDFYSGDKDHAKEWDKLVNDIYHNPRSITLDDIDFTNHEYKLLK